MATTLTTVRDVIVVGGGPAGLQAALTLGRTHRDVAMLDSGSYRNDPADAMHNVIGFDGVTPADFRAAARRDLAAYATVEILDTEALKAASSGDRFVVSTPDGDLEARRLLLATGVRDELPPVPGLDALFGTVAAHCSYCHGHEYSGTPVGILGAGPHVARVALLMERIASWLVVLADGGTLDDDVRSALDAHGVRVRPERVTAVERFGTGARVLLDGGGHEDVGGLMVAPTLRQAAPLAAQLGLELRESGCVAVDPFGRTSRPGVFAAGDLAHNKSTPMPISSVLAAAASGQMAAASIDAELLGL